MSKTWKMLVCAFVLGVVGNVYAADTKVTLDGTTVSADTAAWDATGAFTDGGVLTVTSLQNDGDEVKVLDGSGLTTITVVHAITGADENVAAIDIAGGDSGGVTVNVGVTAAGSITGIDNAAGHGVYLSAATAPAVTINIGGGSGAAAITAGANADADGINAAAAVTKAITVNITADAAASSLSGGAAGEAIDTSASSAAVALTVKSTGAGAATVTGTVATGAGDDTLTVSATAGGNVSVANGDTVNLGAGTNTVDISTGSAATGTVTVGAITGGAGKDTITLTTGKSNVTVGVITLGGTAANTVTGTASGDGTLTVNSMTGGDAVDTISLSGKVTTGGAATFNLGAGGGSLTVDSTADLDAGGNLTVTGGAAADTVSLTNSGTNDWDAVQAMDLAAGNNSLTLKATSTGDITMGNYTGTGAAGTDDIVLTSTGTGGDIDVGTIALGDTAANSVTATASDTGVITIGNITGGDAVDTIKGTGKIDFADITTAAGNDVIDLDINGGAAIATITPGAGNDTVSIKNNDVALTVTALDLNSADTDTDTVTLTGGANNALTITTLTCRTAATNNITAGGKVTLTTLTNIADKITLNSDAALTITNASNLTGTQLVVNADSDSVYGKITAGAAVTADATTTVDVKVNGYIADGKEFTLIDANIANDELITTITDNSAVLSFTNTDDDGVLDITAHRSTYETASSATGNEATAMAALTADRATATGDVKTMLDTMDAMSATELAAASEQLTPESIVGSVDAAMGAVNGFTGTIGSHVGNLRAAGAGAGAVRGPQAPSSVVRGANGACVWVEGVGTWGDQDGRGGKMGYEWDTYGFMLGVDKSFGNDLVAGIAFGYADTDFDADKFSSSDIDSYSLNLYATYNINNNLWVDGAVGYTWADVENKRDVAFLNKTANGDTDSDAWNINAGIGYDFAVGSMWTITPNLKLQYVNFDQDGYTEDGAAGANLKYSDMDEDSFTSYLGVDVKCELNKQLALTARAGWLHEYCDNDATVKASFASGTSFKTTSVDPADDSGIFGIGIEGSLDESITMSLNYDYEVKEDYDAHNLVLGVGVNF